MFGSDWQDDEIWFQERFLEKARWQLKFTWWPRRCIRSNRLIWLELGYCGVWLLTGPGDPVVIKHWMNKNEYLVFVLTK